MGLGFRVRVLRIQIRLCCAIKESNLIAEWIHFTLFGDSITHYKTESVHFSGLMNSATKVVHNYKEASGDSVNGQALPLLHWPRTCEFCVWSFGFGFQELAMVRSLSFLTLITKKAPKALHPVSDLVVSVSTRFGPQAISAFAAVPASARQGLRELSGFLLASLISLDFQVTRMESNILSQFWQLDLKSSPLERAHM